MALLRTPSGDGYYINLHNTLADKDEFNEKNPASTCILGTNGSGKTMLMTFFEIMQQKYGREDSFSPDAKTKRLTTVYLDKDRGAEMNIRALGGRYYRLSVVSLQGGTRSRCQQPNAISISSSN